MIKIFNPRHFLRHGASAPMKAAADGHIVLIRVGEVSPTGKPVIINKKTGNAGKQFDPVRGKVFKLVEVSPSEVTRLQGTLNRQNGTETRAKRKA